MDGPSTELTPIAAAGEMANKYQQFNQPNSGQGYNAGYGMDSVYGGGGGAGLEELAEHGAMVLEDDGDEEDEMQAV